MGFPPLRIPLRALDAPLWIPTPTRERNSVEFTAKHSPYHLQPAVYTDAGHEISFPDLVGLVQEIVGSEE